jgi:hypothetical protein
MSEDRIVQNGKNGRWEKMILKRENRKIIMIQR